MSQRRRREEAQAAATARIRSRHLISLRGSVPPFSPALRPDVLQVLQVRLSSRHATSSSWLFWRCSGIAMVHAACTPADRHGRLVVDGLRVNRREPLTTRIAWLTTSPTSFSHILPLKFALSTTSVRPSHRPRESPCHSRM